MLTRRLLLVEDGAPLARSLGRLLRRAGYEVHLAGTCADAQAAPGRFDAAILDIDLPDGDGVTLAGALVAAGQAARVVFFSGTADAELRERAEALGPFVPKAQGYPALELALGQLFRRRRARAAGAPDPASTAPPASGFRRGRSPG